MSTLNPTEITNEPAVKSNDNRLLFMASLNQPQTAPAPPKKKPRIEQDFLQHILEISRNMAEIRSLEPLLNYVIDEAVKLVGAEQGYIVLVQPDDGLEIEAKLGRGGEILEGIEKDYISKTVFYEVVDTGKPLILRDAINDPRFSEAKSVISLQLRSIMCVPFISRGQTIGAIYVENRSIKNRFNEGDLPLLTLFANQAAVSIENAVLNDDLEIRRDQALEASRFKSELLAKVSHELRTPLGAILGFAEILELGLAGSLNDEQKNIAQNIVTNSERLTTIVNELLDQARLETGMTSLNNEDFSPQILLEQIQLTVGLLAKNKGLEFTTELADDVPHTLVGDYQRLQQILANLSGNAVKFTEQGSVQARIFCPDEKHWAIRVSDTGPGIPKEAQTFIFDPFRQVDGSITRRYGGSGLGLSITKKLTELMNGEILLDSHIGSGTTFTVILPLTPVSEPA